VAAELVMPKWGLSMQQGLIARWLKEEGDTVEKGEALLEVETEKMTNLVESPASGVLARTLYPAGSTVPVTVVIALIAAPGESLPDVAEKIVATPAAPVAPITTVAAAAPTTPGVTVRAMPAARRLAAERGIDLGRLVGSGPQGSITREDVEHALRVTQARPVPRVQKVSFYSEGNRLDGILYAPENQPPGEQRAGVVLLAGYTYLKTLVLPDIAKALGAVGYVTLVFDYRGFGDSEGQRGRLVPAEQVADARAALTFLGDQAHVDGDKLGLVGVSLGGANAIAAAAADARVEAVAAISSPGNGERWLRGLRRYWEWDEFLTRLTNDRSRRVRSGESSRVHPLEIVLPDPESNSFFERIYSEFPQMRCELPLESAEALIDFRPEEHIGRIAPRPVLLVHGAADRLVPVEESRELFGHAGSPRRLEILPGVGHFDWVMPGSAGFDNVTQRVVRFLQEVLPAA
jgi:alpha-beta hydrolase superfamily lysophospholipase